jgi:hypothetical protein
MQQMLYMPRYQIYVVVLVLLLYIVYICMYGRMLVATPQFCDFSEPQHEDPHTNTSSTSHFLLCLVEY